MKKSTYILLSVILSIPLLCGCNLNDSCTDHSVSPETVSQSSEISLDSSDISISDQSSETVSEADSSEEASFTESSEETSQVSADESSEEPKNYISEIYKLEEKYFVSKLPENELRAFSVLYHTALNFDYEAVFDEPLPEDRFECLMWYLNYDCPELINLKGDYSPRYSEEEYNMVQGVGLYYNMQSSEYENCMKELEDYFSALKNETSAMGDFEKEKYVFDKIFSECTFDDYAEKAGSAYGALIEHHGRCEGISKSFAWCMHELGIECLTVAGNPLWSNTGAYSSHSWNIIKIADHYYHVDIAADSMKVSEDEFALPLYGFFNMDDDLMSRSRSIYNYFTDAGLPVCDSLLLNYHVMNGLYISETDDAETRFIEILRGHYAFGEINSISIRFESKEDYNDFVTNGSSRFKQFEAEEGQIPCSDTIYYNDAQITAALYTTP